MIKTWQLQNAKAHFSALFSQVCTEGPQRVTRRGQEAIILISEKQFQSLTGESSTFVNFLLSAPRAELDITRPVDYGREIIL